MNRVILLSHRSDRARVQIIADALIDGAIDAFWVTIPDDGAVSAANKNMLGSASCVVVTWSKAAASSNAFRSLAGNAVNQGKALFVRLDDNDNLDFSRNATTYDLRGWRSSPGVFRKITGGSLFIKELIAGIKYKNLGQDPPPPNAAARMLVRQIIVLVPAIFAPIAAFAAIFGFWVDLGFADQPSDAERIAWEARAPEECDNVREFLRNFPRGHYADEAQALLNGAEKRKVISWETQERPLPLYLSETESPKAASRAAAIEFTEGTRASSEAQRTCEELALAGQSKLRSVTYELEPVNCFAFEGQWQCSVQGRVTCKVDEPRERLTEKC